MAPQPTFLSRLKTHLKMSIQRLRLTQQKSESLSKQSRRAMAELLSAGKIESARIRTENIIRNDLLTELHEILELYCELLLARSGLLENAFAGDGKGARGKEQVVSLDELDTGIYEAVVVIVHAAPRTEIKELGVVRQLLVERYGRGFAEECVRDEKGVVPERVKRKLRVEPPGKELVESYLKAIAGAYDVAYGSDDEDDGGQGKAEEAQDKEGEEGYEDGDDEDGGSGGKQSIEEVGAPGGPKGNAKRAENTPLKATQHRDALKDETPSPPHNDLNAAKSPVRIAPPSPSTDNANPRIRVPGPPDLKPNDKMKKANAASVPKKEEKKEDKDEKKDDEGGPGGKVPDVDDLEARFKLLKR